MNEHQVRASILNYFSEEYAGTADYGNPQRVDPQSESLESWAYCLVDNMQTQIERGSRERFIVFRIVAQCHARASNDLYGASKMAAEVAEVLRNKTINCHDFDASDEPIIGTIRLYEPTLNDETDRHAEEGWQQVNVIVSGIAQELQ